jgi:glutathione S-transferase
MLRIYGDVLSGNCYKVKLLAGLLGLAYDWVHVNITKGESRTAAFLAMTPNGRIPVLEYAPGAYLAESNAILHYLAEGSPFLPTDRLAHAQVLQWMFFEQYSHEPYIATSRYWIKYLNARDAYHEQLELKREPGYAALGVMERRLRRAPFFVSDRATIADVALYAYTHVAHEGDFSLDGYPAIRHWLGRVEALPGYRPMQPA